MATLWNQIAPAHTIQHPQPNIWNKADKFSNQIMNSTEQDSMH